MGNSKFHKPVIHSMKRRSVLNDYSGARIYMITMSKNPLIPSFGRVVGNPSLPPGHPDAPKVELSPYGKIIYEEIPNLRLINDNLDINYWVVMPDHIHFIVFVRDALTRHFGKELAVFKRNCTKRIWEIDKSVADRRISAFEPNYTDSILKRDGQLRAMIKYVQDNPRRKAILNKYPDFFKRRTLISVSMPSVSSVGSSGAKELFRFIGYGNSLLIRHPLKVSVRVRSAWSEEEFLRIKEEWLSLVRQGAVLISPFYSKREKQIKEEALAAGGRVIIMRNQGFPDKFKPAGREFDLCAEGRLLLLAEEVASPFEKQIDRGQAVYLNSLCAEIAESAPEDVRLSVILRGREDKRDGRGD